MPTDHFSCHLRLIDLEWAGLVLQWKSRGQSAEEGSGGGAIPTTRTRGDETTCSWPKLSPIISWTAEILAPLSSRLFIGEVKRGQLSGTVQRGVKDKP